MFGFIGIGIKIVIIDDGIDYYYVDFGGLGCVVDTAVDNGFMIGTLVFLNVKVVGGFDFVGNDYDVVSFDFVKRVFYLDFDLLVCGICGMHVVVLVLDVVDGAATVVDYG